MTTKAELVGNIGDLKDSKTVINHKNFRTMRKRILTFQNIVGNMKPPRLFNFHIDFVKLEILYNYYDINFENLVEHPTIKNQYILKPEIWEHHKNFSVYFTEKKAIIKFSLPYFIYGHNFCELDTQDLLAVRDFMSKELGLEIKFAKIKELEFGAYENIDSDSKDYISSIVGIKNYELEKSTDGFKMFGDRKRNFHYKVYDAVANAKAKKTFTLGNYPEMGLVKHEIKLTSTQPYFDSLYYNDLSEPLSEYRGILEKELISSRKSLILKNENPVLLYDTDLTHILYAGLKQYESGVASKNVVKSLFNLIENSGLTPSQKSKRRKAINLLEDQYNQRF
ncbi:hypothetical protein ACM39_12570 [Chryseobacterium sp. FH2]|uniref:hypothetical protein n=1 Tax=Chryseobacterium sp. FH2 TaxID=1674291 RepID=UPI00065AB9C3|nr:hypothetical protein [Chryseobacterium sp. FH2]KMQ67684.1 hypothetical protein ACM39_12570 [Chryseobacterium sp. FH2]